MAPPFWPGRRLGEASGVGVRRATSAPEQDEAILRGGILARVGDGVDLRLCVILQDQVAALIAELYTAAVEDNARE